MVDRSRAGGGRDDTVVARPFKHGPGGDVRLAALRGGYSWMVGGLASVAAAGVFRLGVTLHPRIDEMVLPYGHVVVIGALYGLGVWLLCVGQVDVLHDTARAGDLAAIEVWRRPIVAALLLHLLAALALPLTSNDIFSYLHYGHLEVHQGIDATSATRQQLLAGELQPWVGDRWRTAVCVYGPPLLWLCDLASLIGGRGSVYGAMIALKALMLLVGASMVWLAWLYARTLSDRRDRRFVFWFLATNPVWLLEVSGQGHNDGVMVALMMGAVIARQRGRRLLCAALLGFGASTKYVAAVPLAFLLLWDYSDDRPLHSRLGRVAAQGLTAAAAMVAPYLLCWRGPLMLLRPIEDLTQFKLAYSFLRLLYYAFYLSGRRVMRQAYEVGTRALWLLLGVLLVRWLLGWRRQRGDRGVPWATALRFLLWHTLLLNSHFLPWYLTWLLPLLLCEPNREWWVIVMIYGFFSLFHYAIDIIVYYDIAEEIINTLWMHLPPLIMLVRMARRRPILFGEKWVPLLRRLGDLSRRGPGRRP
jgi:hypothetical protein